MPKNRNKVVQDDSNSNTPSPVLFCIGLDRKGGSFPIEVNAKELVQPPKPYWLHLRAHHADVEKLLEDLGGIPNWVIHALTMDGTRPRYQQVGEGALVILRGVNLNDGADPEDMVSIRMWVDKERIITLRVRRLRAVNDAKSKLDNGVGAQSTGDLLEHLVQGLLGRMQPVMDDMEAILENCEEEAHKNPKATVRESVVRLRREIILLKRYIAPQRNVIQALKDSHMQIFSSENEDGLQEDIDRITRYMEDLESLRDRATIVNDDLANELAYRINRNMYTLSLFTAIFLPLGFVSGMFGMNVGGIPFASTEHGFIDSIMLMALVAASQLALFKWLKWF